MSKAKLNFIIDALMFLCMMAMAGLGFLMRYTMPSGRDLWAKYGSNPALSWLGWDRHDWGDIHLYLAFTLLALLVLHVYLHWQQVLALFRSLVPNARGRLIIAVIFLVLSLLLLYFPFMITPDQEARERGRGGGRGQHSQVDTSETRVALAVQPGPAGAALNQPEAPPVASITGQSAGTVKKLTELR